MKISAIKRSLIFSVCILIMVESCKEYYAPDPPIYKVKLSVEGSSINQIYFRSVQQNFDVSNVPTKHWSVDMSNHMTGNDTIMLYGRQTRDSLTPIIVSITVTDNNSKTTTYSDTNVAETSVKVYLPK